MSDKELEQVDEVKASFGVDAEVPDATTKEIKDKQTKKAKDEDKKKNPTQGDSVKPTKVAAINNIAQAVKGMSNEDLQHVYANVMSALNDEGYVAESNEEAISVKEMRQIKADDVDISEDVAAMFNGEDLSEGFVGKATTIFEAAVVSKVNEILETVTVDMEAEVEAGKEEIVESLSARLDSYLEYVAEEWMKENELAVEQGIRADISENFMAGLRDLFNESYIDIPEEKMDLVDELASKVEELEANINEEIEKNIDLKQDLIEARKAAALIEMTDDLTESQAIKLANLAEGIDFEDANSYVEKLGTLKENYFSHKEVLSEETNLDEEVLELDGDVDAQENVDPGMAAYMNAISKSIKK